MRPSWLRFPPPLRLSIPLLVLASGLLYLVLTAWILHLRDKARVMESVTTTASQQAARLASMMGKSGDDHEGDVQRDITFLATDARVHWAAVCTPDGTVAYSSLPDWKQRPLATLAPAVVSAAALKTVRDAAPQIVMLGEDSVVAVHPVFHGSDRPAVHLLTLVKRELAASLRSQRGNAISDTLFAAELLLASCLCLWGALHWFLTRRVRLLLTNAQAALSGKPIGPPLAGSDEFAEISRAVRESSSRFHQLTETINDVFYMVCADRSNVLYVSPAYEKVWGRSIANLMENPNDWLQAIPEEDREQVMHMHEPLHHGAPAVTMEYRLRLPDGTMRWIENRSYPVYDERGNLCRISGLATDVTERQHLQSELVNIAERERRRIGHDLHDDLCQRLAAIKLKCEALTEALKRGEMPEPSQAETVSSCIAEATAQCRNIARGLSPVDLTGEGLMAAVEKLVASTESLHEVACFFYCPQPVIVESNSTAVHLYRIAQEFLNNAVRHGKPERIEVRLEMKNGVVRIEVVNDGLPYEEPGLHNHGMGLKILHYRAGAIGATIRIQGRSDGIPGTIAVCQAPESNCNPDPPSQTS